MYADLEQLGHMLENQQGGQHLMYSDEVAFQCVATLLASCSRLQHRRYFTSLQYALMQIACLQEVLKWPLSLVARRSPPTPYGVGLKAGRLTCLHLHSSPCFMPFLDG